MNEFKTCLNGHWYEKTLPKCPYCPKPLDSDNKQNNNFGNEYQTNKFNPNPSNMNQENKDLNKTSIWQPENSGSPSSPSYQPNNQSPTDLSKTQIWDDKNTANQGNNNFTPSSQPSRAHTRKIVGWLVSFTINANGADFRLFEGRNTIGTSPDLDIVVPSDSSVSSRHLTILSRMGSFKYKDELSTNGTFINDIFEDEGTLKDGDKIKIGNTEFIFRSIH